MATSASSSPVKANGTTSSRVDKATLLSALAEELKREKQRAQDWAEKMVEAEAQVEQKHREFLDEEARLSALRDANAATIAAFRKELSKAKQALEEASHVDEREAEAYLALLSNGTSPLPALPSPTGRDRPVSPAQNGEQPAFLSGGFYSTSPDHSHDALHSSAHPVPERPPRPHRPTSLVTGHPYQTPTPYSPPPFQSTVAGYTPIEQSVWQDSIDEPQSGGVHPELAKNGGRWSKVFPSLKRRNSEVKRA